MKEYSEIFDWYYDIESTVRICNMKQSSLYIKHGVKLVDIFYSKDTLVFVFDKKSSRECYEKWCNHELS